MTYPRAPIAEAVMDIRVQAREGLDPEVFRGLSREVESSFSQVEDLIRFSAEIRAGETPTHVATQVKAGFRFLSDSRDRLFQAQIDGWSFNKLAPYESWAEFGRQGRMLWDKYRSLAKPERITRLALRYVNRLDLPLPIDDFKKYLNTVPEVGAGLPQGLTAFFMQLQIPHESARALLNLNLALAPPPREGVISVILDLDLFRDQDVPQDEQSIWDCFEVLRTTKNQAFEACITDATRELFR